MNLLASSSSASGVLTDAMLSSITDAFSNLSATVSQVLVVAVPATVGIIALSAGVKYALKKVRGALSQAS